MERSSCFAQQRDSPALSAGLAGGRAPTIAPQVDPLADNATSGRPTRRRFCRPGESAVGGGVHGPAAYRRLRCRQGRCGVAGVRSAEAGDGTPGGSLPLRCLEVGRFCRTAERRAAAHPEGSPYHRQLHVLFKLLGAPSASARARGAVGGNAAHPDPPADLARWPAAPTAQPRRSALRSLRSIVRRPSGA